ncbi:MAG TPA: hypothetical protein VL403_05075 [Candidatus Kryptonia bacterium]|nr:hypothetical protein [Candidatus Kryptonia bacterium]
MRYRGSIAAAFVGAALIAPFGAFAQPITGTVTTGPTQQAPTLSLPLIALLAVALTGIALYRLRVRGPIMGLILFAVLVGTSYALGTINITGAECATQTTRTFFPGQTLKNECANNVQILAIQFDCPMPEFPPNSCTVGEILMSGQTCRLPECPT